MTTHQAIAVRPLWTDLRASAPEVVEDLAQVWHHLHRLAFEIDAGAAQHHLAEACRVVEHLALEIDHRLAGREWGDCDYDYDFGDCVDDELLADPANPTNPDDPDTAELLEAIQ